MSGVGPRKSPRPCGVGLELTVNRCLDLYRLRLARCWERPSSLRVQRGLCAGSGCFRSFLCSRLFSGFFSSRFFCSRLFSSCFLSYFFSSCFLRCWLFSRNFFSSWLLSGYFFGCWLFSCNFFSSWLLGRYFLRCWLFSCNFFSSWLLSRYFFSCWLFSRDFLSCWLFGRDSFLCRGLFSGRFFCSCHFCSPRSNLDHWVKNTLHGFCVQNDSWRWTRVQPHEQGTFTTTPRARVFVRVANKLGDMCVYLSHQSQDKAPPDWYSITRVSKKLRSFLRSIISLIQGNGFSSLGNRASKPICVARRLAM